MGLWGACSALGEGEQSLQGQSPLRAPSPLRGIYCKCCYSPFPVQRFGISSGLRGPTAAAGLARGSSRAALDLWGSQTLRKAQSWSNIPWKSSLQDKDLLRQVGTPPLGGSREKPSLFPIHHPHNDTACGSGRAPGDSPFVSPECPLGTPEPSAAAQGHQHSRAGPQPGRKINHK